MRLVSFDGISLDSPTTQGGIPWDAARNQFSLGYRIVPRPGTDPTLGALALSERILTIELAPAPKSGEVMHDAHDRLQGMLFASPYIRHTLIAERHDLTLVQREVVVTKPAQPSPDGSINWLRVELVSTDIIWRSTEAESYGPLYRSYNGDGDTPDSLAVFVGGYAAVSPVIRLSRVDTDPGASSSYRHRRSFTLTNNGTKTWWKHPIQIPLGDTTTGWSGAGGYAGAGANVALYLNGMPQRRSFVAFGRVAAFLWLVVDHLEPGESLTYDLVWTADGQDVLTHSGRNAPAFDRSWWDGTATAGGASTLTDSGRTFETNQWARATLLILTGTGAGQEALVLSNTGTVITINGTWTTNPDATSTYLVYHSRNDRWTPAVRQTERTGEHNGGTGTGQYWINKTQSKPDDSDFAPNVPGAWAPYSYLENRDERNQETAGTPVNVGTLDYFGILDTDRTWQDGAVLKDAGLADGLMFSSPRKIEQWRFDGLFKNPNGLAKAFFGSRSAGSLGWTSVREETTAADSLTHFGTSTYVLEDDTYQLVMALLPLDEAEIPLSWAKDSGTATHGDNGTATAGAASTLTDSTKSWGTNVWAGYRLITTGGTGSGQNKPIASNTGTVITITGTWATNPDATTQYVIAHRSLLQDATKEWVTDQWVNARARITNGRGEGAQAVVTANTATQLTAAFGVDIDATSRYEIQNKHLVATLRTDTFLYLVLDDSTIGISAISADTADNNQLAVTVRNGGGVSPALPYQQLRVGVDRTVFVADDQEVVIDCATKRAGVYDGATLIQALTDAVAVDDLDADGNPLGTASWMELLPGSSTFYMDNVSHIGVNLTVDVIPGYFG